MKRLINAGSLADKEQTKQELNHIDLYRNSINAIEHEWPKNYAMRPILSMLACIANLLCEVLEKMGAEIIRAEEDTDEPDPLEET